MKVRYLLGGIGVVGAVSMATALGVIGVNNNEKSKLIEKKRDELNAVVYPVIPSESRTLLSPIGPAYPSPGYEN